MDIPLANYEKERGLFQQLLQPQSQERILMFHGQSGSGKSVLLRHCMSQVPSQVSAVSIQLRSGDFTVTEIFQRMGRRVGWERLLTFAYRVAAFQGKREAAADLNWRADMTYHLETILNTPDLKERRQRSAALTEAWFADVRHFPAPFLLAFDTFEQASTEVTGWITESLLVQVAETGPVRVVLAGKTVPDANNVEWGHCCYSHELPGVSEASAWLPVAEAMGRHVPDVKWLAGICYYLKGHPKNILAFIETLPVVSNLRPPVTTDIDLAHLRQQMSGCMDDTDVQEICFDLNIKYDDLDGNNTRLKIMALIMHLKHHGRLPELLAHLREIRSHLDW